MSKNILLTLFCIILVGSGCPQPPPQAPNSFQPGEIQTRTVPDLDFMELMDEKLTYVDPDGLEWIAPQGTYTDGATIPRLALWITDGRFNHEFLKAALIHDAYCQKENDGRCPQYHSRRWQAVHRMFYNACLAGGTHPLLAKTMFAAVWIGGPRWDDPADNRRDVSDEMLRVSFDSCEQYIRENEPKIGDIESWVDAREPTLVNLSRLESQAISALTAGNPSRADSALSEADALLSRELRRIPNDLMLQNLQGFHAKNLAATYKKLNMPQKENEELTKAENTFSRIIISNPNDPSAHTGLGSIMIQRNNYERATEQFNKVLSVAPNHPVAKEGLRRIER